MADPEGAEQPQQVPGGFRCDFCGATVPRVRRVALDRGYDRLQTPHQVRYACPECSERKERSRREGAGS
jgi:hypothetical protein